jgi:hypothetical protein
MKKLIFFGLFLALFSFGCSALILTDTQVSLQKAVRQNTFLLAARIEFYKRNASNEKNFYISYNKDSLVDHSDLSSMPYKCLKLDIRLPELQENKEYCVYCPNTGDPAFPEYVAGVKRTNKKIETIFPSHYPTTLSSHDPYVFANPGYCSDWFIFSVETGERFYSSFIYEPIIASLPTGETLLVSKKEPGGNILEISLNNFPPNKKVTLKSCSEGELFEDQFETSKEGSFCLPNFIPGVNGVTKGTDHISVLWDDHVLSVSVDWDTSTLSIKKMQPDSGVFTWK